MCGGVAVFVLLVLLALLVLGFYRQSTQLGKMQAPRHRLRFRAAVALSLPPALTRLPLSHAPKPHTRSTSGLWQTEIIQLGSKSITLSSDEEPTIATNTRSASPPPPYAPELEKL